MDTNTSSRAQQLLGIFSTWIISSYILKIIYKSKGVIDSLIHLIRIFSEDIGIGTEEVAKWQ